MLNLWSFLARGLEAQISEQQNHRKGRESGQFCRPLCFTNSDCFSTCNGSCKMSNSVPSGTWDSHLQYKMPVFSEELLKNQ